MKLLFIASKLTLKIVSKSIKIESICQMCEVKMALYV